MLWIVSVRRHKAHNPFCTVVAISLCDSVRNLSRTSSSIYSSRFIFGRIESQLFEMPCFMSPEEWLSLTVTLETISRCPWLCRLVVFVFSLSMFHLSSHDRLWPLVTCLKCKSNCKCSLLRCRHFMTPQPTWSWSTGPTLALQCFPEGLLHGAPHWKMASEKGPGYETLSSLCIRRRRGYLIIFRRPWCRPPVLSPCGVVSASSFPAAGGFSMQPWAEEATPVCCHRSSSCRQRVNTVTRLNPESPRLFER